MTEAVYIPTEIYRIKRDIKKILKDHRLINSDLGNYRLEYLRTELSNLQKELKLRREIRGLSR